MEPTELIHEQFINGCAKDVKTIIRHRLLTNLYSTNINLLKPRFQKYILLNLQLIECMLKWKFIANELGCNFLILKGPILSQQLYGSPSKRQYYDLDIFIYRKDLDKVLKYFFNEGFQVKKPIAYKGREEKVVEWQLRKNRIMVELRFIDDDPVLLHEQRIEVELNNQKVPTLNNNANLVYIVNHACRHVFVRFQWLLDVHSFLENMDYQPDNVIDCARKYGYYKKFRFTMFLVDKVFQSRYTETFNFKKRGLLFPVLLYIVKRSLETRFKRNLRYRIRKRLFYSLMKIQSITF